MTLIKMNSDLMPIIEEVEKILTPTPPSTTPVTPQNQLAMNIIHILNLLVTLGLLVAYVVGHYKYPNSLAQ